MSLPHRSAVPLLVLLFAAQPAGAFSLIEAPRVVRADETVEVYLQTAPRTAPDALCGLYALLDDQLVMASERELTEGSTGLQRWEFRLHEPGEYTMIAVMYVWGQDDPEVVRWQMQVR